MGIFTDLQTEQERQRKLLAAPAPANNDAPAAEHEHVHDPETEHDPAHERAQKSAHEVAQKREHPVEQVAPLEEKSLALPPTEAVEMLTFRTRHAAKIKVNTEVPRAWKAQLDDISHRLRVGKYELLAYIIASFLDEV